MMAQGQKECIAEYLFLDMHNIINIEGVSFGTTFFNQYKGDFVNQNVIDASGTQRDPGC